MRVIRRRPEKPRGLRERGQALVEFALIVPIFVLLVFAIVDFGMGLHAWITVTNSAREGARLGAVGGTSSAIESRVRGTADSLDQDKLTVTVTGAQGSPGQSVIVGARYNYSLITPISSIMNIISGGSLGPTLTFSSTANMRLE